MIEGRCDCGAVRWAMEAPASATACNCGYCRRAGALWAYGDRDGIRVEGETVAWMRGDRTLAFHRCARCGIVTHWDSLAPEGAEGHGRRAANLRLAEPPGAVAAVPVRRFDGAGAWRELRDGEEGAVPFLGPRVS